MEEGNPNIIYTYDKFTKAVKEHPITRIDSCLFAFFDYEGEEVCFDTRHALVSTLHRVGKPNLETVLASFDKRSLIYIKDSDIAFQKDVRSKIMNEVAKLL